VRGVAPARSASCYWSHRTQDMLLEQPMPSNRRLPSGGPWARPRLVAHRMSTPGPSAESRVTSASWPLRANSPETAARVAGHAHGALTAVTGRGPYASVRPHGWKRDRRRGETDQ
jgi:hypothetical protein